MAHEAIIRNQPLYCTGQPDRAELTVTIRDDWQGKKLGKMLVSRVVDIARSRGIATIEILLDSRNEADEKTFQPSGLSGPLRIPICSISLDHIGKSISSRKKTSWHPMKEVLIEFRL